ncbi:hypothetical protein WSK_3137 [Novosphingobium sp. Rr 2-17]|nr:hypothetical protein WSK_3137 [Novosphingobium sp. Rr 2-17]
MVLNHELVDGRVPLKNSFLSLPIARNKMCTYSTSVGFFNALSLVNRIISPLYEFGCHDDGALIHDSVQSFKPF